MPFGPPPGSWSVAGESIMPRSRFVTARVPDGRFTRSISISSYGSYRRRQPDAHAGRPSPARAGHGIAADRSSLAHALDLVAAAIAQPRRSRRHCDPAVSARASARRRTRQSRRVKLSERIIPASNKASDASAKAMSISAGSAAVGWFGHLSPGVPRCGFRQRPDDNGGYRDRPASRTAHGELARSTAVCRHMARASHGEACRPRASPPAK